jgi:hypothetical protein
LRDALEAGDSGEYRVLRCAVRKAHGDPDRALHNVARLLGTKVDVLSVARAERGRHGMNEGRYEATTGELSSEIAQLVE